MILFVLSSCQNSSFILFSIICGEEFEVMKEEIDTKRLHGTDLTKSFSYILTTKGLSYLRFMENIETQNELPKTD